MSVDAKLKKIRVEIDAVDSELLKLFNKRAELAKQVADVKLEAGESVVFYRPEREAQVLRRVKEQNPGPLDSEEVARLFREVMSACLALEKPMEIAFLGPEGTFTQTAVLKHFGHSVMTRPMKSIDAIFRDVEAGSADYGVVPIENSTEGVINHTLDSLVHSSLHICGEVEIRIHQNLMSMADNLADIKVIYSHAQSLAQCRQWLNRFAGDIELIEVSSNAEAARMASKNSQSAAIAGESAAEIYGLKIIERNVEDNPNNTTRFLILGKGETPPSGNDKTVLLISTKNKPGALFDLLEPLSRNGISMTRIESRPSHQGMWEYLFFVDLEGHSQDENVAIALKQLHKESSLFKVLGSFPKAVL